MLKFSRFLILMFVFIATNAAAQMPLVELSDGLKYKDKVVGKGEEALQGKVVTVDYTGWLLKADGTKGNKFDSSYDSGRKFNFRLGAGDVIKGWDMGVMGMKVGGERELRIPSKLAYGSQAIGKVIPANSNLIFDVKLHEVK